MAFEAQRCEWRQIGFAALSLGIKYDISQWRQNESIQMLCPQRYPWSTCLTQCSCFTKDMCTGAQVDLHNKKDLDKKPNLSSWMWAGKQVRAQKGRIKLRITHTNTHCSASPICMPVRPQSRGDNKSHFLRVCQVFRRHFSPGSKWWVGSEQSKQGHRYPCLIESATSHWFPASPGLDKTLERCRCSCRTKGFQEKFDFSVWTVVNWRNWNSASSAPYF